MGREPGGAGGGGDKWGWGERTFLHLGTPLSCPFSRGPAAHSFSLTWVRVRCFLVFGSLRVSARWGRPFALSTAGGLPRLPSACPTTREGTVLGAQRPLFGHTPDVHSGHVGVHSAPSRRGYGGSAFPPVLPAGAGKGELFSLSAEYVFRALCPLLPHHPSPPPSCLLRPHRPGSFVWGPRARSLAPQSAERHPQLPAGEQAQHRSRAEAWQRRGCRWPPWCELHCHPENAPSVAARLVTRSPSHRCLHPDTRFGWQKGKMANDSPAKSLVDIDLSSLRVSGPHSRLWVRRERGRAFAASPASLLSVSVRVFGAGALPRAAALRPRFWGSAPMEPTSL